MSCQSIDNTMYYQLSLHIPSSSTNIGLLNMDHQTGVCKTCLVQPTLEEKRVHNAACSDCYGAMSLKNADEANQEVVHTKLVLCGLLVFILYIAHYVVFYTIVLRLLQQRNSRLSVAYAVVGLSEAIGVLHRCGSDTHPVQVIIHLLMVANWIIIAIELPRKSYTYLWVYICGKITILCILSAIIRRSIKMEK